MLAGTLGQVDPYQQQTRVSCSAASMHAVLKHYGIDIPEQALYPLIGLTSEGAWPHQIVSACSQMGLKAFDLRFSLDMARRFTSSSVPVIADVESWNHPGRGHFVVLTSIEGGVAQVMDPNTPGNWRVLPLAELARRWAYSTWAGVVILPPERSRRR